MSIAFRLLTLLLAALPVLAILHDSFARDAVGIIAAILLALAAMTSPSEITPTAQLLKRLALAMLFPIVWMILQIAPLPVTSLTNPIWSSAAVALNDPSLPARVSLDPGSTLRGLIVYLNMLALMVATLIITRDRRRAETTLLVLSVMMTFMATEVLLGQLAGLQGIVPASETAAAATYTAASGFGILLNAATVLMATERRRSGGTQRSAALPFRIVLGLSGIAICGAALWSLAQSRVSVAVAFGFAAMLFISTARRLGVRPWISVIVFLFFAMMIAALSMPQLQTDASAGIAGFAASASAGSVMLARRALSATPWLGNGVGTFQFFAGIYQDFGTPPIVVPPSTAVAIATEWGQPALLLLSGFALQLFAFTFRGAVRRGRDSFFSSAAAACVLLAFGEAFFDPSLWNVVVQAIVAIIVGLGLSQSIGRTSGLDH